MQCEVKYTVLITIKIEFTTKWFDKGFCSLSKVEFAKAIWQMKKKLIILGG